LLKLVNRAIPRVLLNIMGRPNWMPSRPLKASHG
jgi:hypothetical protein